MDNQTKLWNDEDDQQIQDINTAKNMHKKITRKNLTIAEGIQLQREKLYKNKQSFT